jgi:hypothetical protein
MMFPFHPWTNNIHKLFNSQMSFLVIFSREGHFTEGNKENEERGSKTRPAFPQANEKHGTGFLTAKYAKYTKEFRPVRVFRVFRGKNSSAFSSSLRKGVSPLLMDIFACRFPGAGAATAAGNDIDLEMNRTAIEHGAWEYVRRLLYERGRKKFMKLRTDFMTPLCCHS